MPSWRAVRSEAPVGHARKHYEVAIAVQDCERVLRSHLEVVRDRPPGDDLDDLEEVIFSLVQEEEQAAQGVAGLIEPVTRRYVELTTSGDKADR